MADDIVKKNESKLLNELYEIKKANEREKGVIFTQQDIANIGGWTQPNVSSYLRGKVELKEDSAAVFSEALGVPVSAFSPRLSEKIKKRELLASNPQLNSVKISYVPKYSFSMLDVIRNHIKDVTYTMPITNETTPIVMDLSKNAFSLTLEDRSLEGTHEQGTVFIFDPLLTPKPTDMVLAAKVDTQGEYVIRQYKVNEILEDGTEVFELHAFNSAYPTLRNNYEILAVATAIQKNLR
ncbi:helix-turn-helix domain-containing protein [Acinetobacter sp. CFCC 10889]|uniref:helix-turn-helix domain-containing protein n=1 Tax=Acinetobacter sp. CFCC 10889 TaxID=1775557 RepID=UPI000DD02901|nr:helix-turn-helix transcriptional regulator [Acinetobacter sp. CFCC 10889]